MTVRYSFVLLGLIALGAFPALAADEAIEETLRLETGSIVGKIFTPRRAVEGGKRFGSKGDNNHVRIGGKSFKIGAAAKGRRLGLAIDEDGDDKISRSEFKSVHHGGAATFDLKLDDSGETYPVAAIDVYVMTRRGNVTGFGGKLIPGWAMRGRVGRETIRLVDANIDGIYTQDGRDAILIGNNSFAVPLRDYHKIDGTLYKLDVPTDAKTIKFTPQEAPALGKVETKFPGAMLKSLVLSSEEGHSYDVVELGEEGIPAGTYKVDYAALVSGRNYAFMLPSETTYEIQADGRNQLRLGPDFMLVFNARARGENIHISTQTEVMGAGGEKYRFSDDPGRPKAYFYAGKKRIGGGAFEKG